MLDLRLVWDDASPVVLFCHSGRKFVLFQANVVHHLPLITHPELKILLLALNASTTTGEIWNYHRWSEHLGYQLEEYLWPSAPPSTAYSPLPPGLTSTGEGEAQAMFSLVDLGTSLQMQVPDSTPVKSLNVTEYDCPTEDEEETEATVEEARRIVTTHTLPKARSRTNISTPEYVLTPDQLQELREHIASGHVKMSNLCKGCLLSEGPRRMHRRIRDVDRATHCLHIDIAGPLPPSVDGYFYFLVGALRLPELPLLLDARLLKTRTSLEVCSALETRLPILRVCPVRGLKSLILAA